MRFSSSIKMASSLTQIVLQDYLNKYGRTLGKEEGKKAEEKNSSNLSSPFFFFFVSPCLTKLFFLFLGHMTDLINTEKDLVVSLKDYIKAEESKLEQIKK